MKNRRFPFGYEMENGKIKICDKESVVLIQVFKEYLSGKNLKDIAESLTVQQIEYLPGETDWNKSRIKRMIEDKRYLGDDKYPKIIDRQIFTQANAVKAERRTTTNYVVDAMNKPLVYAVQCACCGALMIHKTDRRTKSKERWLCDSEKCQSRIYMTIEEIKQLVTALLNDVISNPTLADQKKTESEVPSEIRLMENEIDRMLEQPDFDRTEIQNKILGCAAKKYELDKSTAHITDRLKADFERSSPLSDFCMDLFQKTVSAVLINIDGSVSLVLKNGNIIGKDEINGNKHDSTQGGKSDTPKAGLSRRKQP